MTTAQYYIITGSTQNGPYDLVMLVRKIRNGTLTAGTMIQQVETSIVKPAQDWATLADFFNERIDDTTTASSQSHTSSHSLGATLSSGWRFLQRNQVSTIFSGVFVLTIIMITGLIHLLLPGALQVPAYMACFIFSHFLFSCYLFSVLRMTRGQPVDVQYLLSRIRPAIKSLLLSSMIISFPAIVGLVLLASGGEIWEVSLAGLLIFAIPGLYILTLYAFTPLLILDQELDFWDAMEMSRKRVQKSGMENTGVLFALFVINFIAGLCFLLPLVIILPITTSPLTEIYDEFFS